MKGNKMRTSVFCLVIAGILLCILSGCTYYRITDPTTNKIYYTKGIDDRRSGAVVITDAKTKRKVTLQDSEVEKISRDEFIVGVYETKN
jgi:hypothetical protein